MHQEYISHFKRIWNEQFLLPNFCLEISQLNDNDGVTSVNVKFNDKIKYIVKYAYNHLDYKEGVSLYEFNENRNQKNLLLPKDGNYVDNSYGYSEEEIERFIKDIFRIIKTTANNV
tara:strand:- start:78 stop:425 length:348 start_codon:yes stop_codon:yes gene_type:complete